MQRQKILVIVVVSLSVTLVLMSHAAHAAITGPCSNCHTMHNSQGGTAMATYGDTGGVAQPMLLRGTCLGCHAQLTGNKIESLGSSQVPQVYHTDIDDLAGGNFAYIDGTKGGSASDAKGHNVKDLFPAGDTPLDLAPGAYKGDAHKPVINDGNLTCAGFMGCHGFRTMDLQDQPAIAGLKGAHHGNEDGSLGTADAPGNSYRFLLGVWGLENPTATPAERWQNINASKHNEYYGSSSPKVYTDSACTECHFGGYVQATSHTMSDFCATCHGDFHRAGGTVSNSQFIRHPTDVLLPSGEYSSYVLYSVEAPVARTGGVPSSVSVSVGGTDAVMCLSCHAAHGSPWPDMLRWDYDTMNAGGGGADGTGCFTCHTSKDGTP